MTMPRSAPLRPSAKPRRSSGGPRPTLLLAAALLALAPTVRGDEGDGEGADAAWDVADPPGERFTVEIDTEETTWSNLDVSPDGHWIVFDALGDLYRLPIAGGEAEALTEGIAWDIQPRISPDGTRIAWVSDRAGGDNLWVAELDLEAGELVGPRAVSAEGEHLVHNPAWSPDGDYLAGRKGFTTSRSIDSGELWLFHVGVDGGPGLQLVERPHGDVSQKNVGEPAFSPDGRFVYYSQDVTPGTVWQYGKDSTGEIFAILRLDRETGEIDRVTGGPGGAVRPTPSPDGKRLAFVRRRPGLVSALVVRELDSGRETIVFDRFERDHQETAGSHGNAPAFAWTPDGGSLVFWTAGRLHRLELASGEAKAIPMHLATTREVQPALRVPVAVAPETFRVRMPRWAARAPTDDRVVFQALGKLWLRDGEAGRTRRVTVQEDHVELAPTWSRDGATLVYATWDDAELGAVRAVSPAGVESRVLTPEPGHWIEPAVSPDGRWVVARKTTGGHLLSPLWSREPGLWLLPLAVDGEARRLDVDGFEPHFGADPERVYFSVPADSSTLELRSVDLDGADERTHLRGDEVTSWRVSPDGAWVAFTRDYDAWVAPFPATGRPVSLSSATTALPVRKVSARAGDFLHWTVDAEGLAAGLGWSQGPTLYERRLAEAFAFLEGAPEELPEPVEEGLDLSFEVRSDRPEGTIALVGGRIVTMRRALADDAEVIEDGTIVVERDRIVAVGPRGEVDVPAGAAVVELEGRTVLPGLVDVHAHGAQAREEIVPEQSWVQMVKLAFGVTTTHDPSNDTTEIFAAAELQKAGKLVAPRIFSTGTILYGAHAPGATVAVDSLEDALFHVRRLADAGAISVKSYQMPRRDQRQQIVAAGRELGIMVLPEGGMKLQHNLNEIVDGHTGIEHSLPVQRAYEDVLQLWGATAVGYTPTLGVSFGGLEGERWFYAHDEVWKNERLMAFTPRSEVLPRAMRREIAPDDHWNHVWVARGAKALLDRGVSVQLGAHGQRHGLDAHWELWMFEQGGFTPWEALRAGTIAGAWYVGLDGDLGSLEVGKLADLFVVDGNPLEDLRSSERVVWTMLGGRLYDAATMDRVLPDEAPRAPFWFEEDGTDSPPPAETVEWTRRLRSRFGWSHP